MLHSVNMTILNEYDDDDDALTVHYVNVKNVFPINTEQKYSY